jgi:hypothetical protein
MDEWVEKKARQKPHLTSGSRLLRRTSSSDFFYSSVLVEGSSSSVGLN